MVTVTYTTDVKKSTLLPLMEVDMDNTVAADETLAVTTADKLTVGGVIVPTELVFSVPLDAASAVDQNVFVADAAYKVAFVKEAHTVAGDDSGAVTATLKKCTSTQAPSSGTACTSNSFDLKGTANTVQSGTLSTTPSDYTLANGNRLALDITGTPTSLAGGVVTIGLIRV